MLGKRGRDDLHDRGAGEHARLDRISSNVAQASYDLVAHEIRRDVMDARDPQGILHSHCRDRRHRVAAKRFCSLDIGLQTSTTA